MQVMMLPFFSQIRDGKFRLSTCGACKQLAWIAKRLDRCTVLLPYDYLCESEHPFECKIRRMFVPPDNRKQRWHCDAAALEHLLRDADTVICNHETMAAPVRAVCDARVVQMLTVAPEESMKPHWDAADLMVVHGQAAQDHVQQRTSTPTVQWNALYDADEYVPQQRDRDIDVLFLQRCSSTNYTHHEEFLEALPKLNDLSIVFTDVTGWLRKRRPDLQCMTGSFIDTLTRTKVAVSLQSNMYGGQSAYAAAAMGCTLVTLPNGTELASHVTSLDGIATAVRHALAHPLQADASKFSYQSAWPAIQESLCLLQ